MIFDRLRALCAAKTDNLADLAEIAAPGDPAFFDGAQFSGADLRDTNLTGFSLQGAALKGAKIDETTILPETTSLLDIKGGEDDTPYAIHVVDGISSVIQKEVISSLDNLEKSAAKQESSNIKGPIPRRSPIIPQKNDSERSFRLNSIRRMRRLANDIVASTENDLTIGGVLKNVERLVQMIGICETLMRRYEPRTYQQISRSINLEIEKHGVAAADPEAPVSITRRQWKAILSGLTSRITNLRQSGDFMFRGGSGEILGSLMLRIFFVLEDIKDLYLALPADQQKIDPVSFQIQLEPADENSGSLGLQEPYVM